MSILPGCRMLQKNLATLAMTCKVTGRFFGSRGVVSSEYARHVGGAALCQQVAAPVLADSQRGPVVELDVNLAQAMRMLTVNSVHLHLPCATGTAALPLVLPSTIGATKPRAVTLPTPATAVKEEDPSRAPLRPEIRDPRPVVEKRAARLIVIRRRKMKKHKLRKLRKKMYFEWAKVRNRREQRKEKAFQAELLAQMHAADTFDAESWAQDILQRSKRYAREKEEAAFWQTEEGNRLRYRTYLKLRVLPPWKR